MTDFNSAVQKLQNCLKYAKSYSFTSNHNLSTDGLERHAYYAKEALSYQDYVLNRFGSLFSTSNIMNLSTTEFSEFTMPTQNHQWNGLYRHNNTVLTNMSLLRDTLSHLLYDNKRVEERINIANKSIEGLGQGIISVLLFIAHPKDFSPWTSVTGSGLTNLGVMGRIQGKTLGDRYVFVNNIITRLCNASAMTRWEIDSIWTLIPYVYAEF